MALLILETLNHSRRLCFCQVFCLIWRPDELSETHYPGKHLSHSWSSIKMGSRRIIRPEELSSEELSSVMHGRRRTWKDSKPFSLLIQTLTAFAILSYGKRDFLDAEGRKTGIGESIRVAEEVVGGPKNLTLGQNGVTWRKRPETRDNQFT